MPNRSGYMRDMFCQTKATKKSQQILENKLENMLLLHHVIVTHLDAERVLVRIKMV